MRHLCRETFRPESLLREAVERKTPPTCPLIHLAPSKGCIQPGKLGWSEDKLLPLFSLVTGRRKLKQTHGQVECVHACALTVDTRQNVQTPVNDWHTLTIVVTLVNCSWATKPFPPIQGKKELICRVPKGNDPGVHHVQRRSLAVAVWYLGQNQLGKVVSGECYRHLTGWSVRSMLPIIRDQTDFISCAQAMQWLPTERLILSSKSHTGNQYLLFLFPC